MKKENNQSDKNESRFSKNERIEQELQKLYEFRFNIIRTRTEYREVNTLKPYEPVNRFSLNTFRRKLDIAGIITSTENIRSILESNYSKQVHPIKEYFSSLPLLNPEENGYIKQLLHTVEVSNPEKWEEYFTKWLIGTVANAMEDNECKNHTCLVLTGEQGRFKTTWLNHLCPKSIDSYIFTGKIDPQSKDVLTLIAECLFINIDDQLKKLNKRDEDELKNLITIPKVKYRRPYDIHIEDYPHLASFMASVNGNDFLTDPTGSRRFLPFEVITIHIDKMKSINMDNVFSEIMYLYKKGVRYWFDYEEIVELHRQSTGFQVQTVEFELLMQWFEKPTEKEERLYFMTTAQVINHLNIYTTIHLNEKRMGEALRKSGFKRVQKRMNSPSFPVYGYRIKKIMPVPIAGNN